MTVLYRISFHLAQYFKIFRAQKIRFSHLNFPFCCPLYRGADKSLAPARRKQATATKLSLLQATQKKKKFRRLSIQPGLCGSNDLCVWWKMAIFQLFFQSGRAKDLSAPLYSASFGPHCTQPPDHRSFVCRIAGAHIVTFPKLKPAASSASSCLHLSDVP